MPICGFSQVNGHAYQIMCGVSVGLIQKTEVSESEEDSLIAASPCCVVVSKKEEVGYLTLSFY